MSLIAPSSMPYSSLPLAFGAVAIASVLWKLMSYVRFHMASAPLRRFPGPPKESLWSGNLRQFVAPEGEDFQKHVAFDYGPIVCMSGYFGRPLLYVYDPKALYNVLIKEEHVFQEQEVFTLMNSKVFGPSLLATRGRHHGMQRKLMNPVFSVNHMRYMLPIFYSVSQKLVEAIKTRVQNGPREIDILHWMGRTSLELVGQAGLGYSFDPLVGDSEDRYGQAIKALVPNLGPLLHLRWLVVLAHKLRVPTWLQRSFIRAFPANSATRRLADVVDTMDKCSREIYDAKKRAFEQGDAKVVEQIGKGKDILSILIRANAQSNVNERLPEEEVIAQLTTLIFAAMDTSSNTLARILQLLAQHTDVQSRLRRELLDASAAQELSYEELNKLPLLDGVCRETLRVHPAAATNRFRVADSDTVLPLSEPISTTDGEVMSKIPIPKGTDVLIGVLGSNMNKALWGDDAHEWKPERWLSPLPPAVADARIPGVYSNLLTFIGGKRACIGFKFAEMAIKVVLATLISNFTFELSDKQIMWNVSSITYPSVGKHGGRPELPMKVGIYKAE